MQIRNGRRGWDEYRYKLTVKVSDKDASNKGFSLVVNHNFIAEHVCMYVCMYVRVLQNTWYLNCEPILHTFITYPGWRVPTSIPGSYMTVKFNHKEWSLVSEQ